MMNMPTFNEGGSLFQAWQLRLSEPAARIIEHLCNVELSRGSQLPVTLTDPFTKQTKPNALMINVADLYALRDAFRWTPTHKHIKSGGLYRLLAPASNEADRRLMAIYENEHGELWLRPLSEFLDGRFEPLPEFVALHEEMQDLLEIDTDVIGGGSDA